jgi:hypothetical protein
MNRAALILAGLIATAAGRALADPPTPADPWCRNGSFPTDVATFGLAKVTGAPRAYLHDCVDLAPGCTDQPRTPYVVPGDLVITGKVSGANVCVLMPNRVGGSAGWVRSAEIAPLPRGTPALADWVGAWTEGDDSIHLSLRGAKLVVHGDACWPSCHPSRAERPGGPNVGELGGSAPPGGDTLVIDDASTPPVCAATLRLIGPYLLVTDNNQCGGMNVTFTGAYRRAAVR